jgi:hypothetical protein
MGRTSSSSLPPPLLLLLLAACVGCGCAVSPTELAALSELFNATGGGAWTNAAGWMRGDACAIGSPWLGLTCSADGRSVMYVAALACVVL